ncbi:uncharacterized acetyltransferase At3g50280-like [Lolium perenne]|uniref:uncharacterized acetyltransferase At3g50280-like n=1 Tax=Lolium perenne TaxID=4522 RepID=UPI0021F54C0E|nr:uncharacterized acetyltransferase At3g50280-like [Lolium perenne]
MERPRNAENTAAYPDNMAPPISAAPVPASVPASIITVVSKQTVRPERASPIGDLKLSFSDMLMLSCSYIQKGLFFQPSGTPMAGLLSSLVSSLSRALGVFPPLAGRLVTLPDGRIVIRCDDDAAVEFFHAVAPALSLADFLVSDADVPTMLTKELFPMAGAVSYEGHHRPLSSFQVTELGDGAFFLSVVVNHAVVDGTSFWHFFNTWAGLCRGDPVQPPDFGRSFFGGSTAVLRFSGRDGPAGTLHAAPPLRERVVHFSAAAIRDLKAAANGCGKTNEDSMVNGEISSFQSICAHMWLAVTRARLQLAADATTRFIMAVNCRHRLRPKISPVYFGNAIQILATTATVAELAANGLRWAAARLHAKVAVQDDGAIRQAAADWEAAPWCFSRGNLDSATLIIGSSPRFPMYDGTDFGWGKAVAVRSGCDSKIDGVLSALPGQAGDGSVDVEVCLAPDTMARLLGDNEFLQYVSHAP